MVVELKRVERFDPVFEAQISSYMKLGKYKIGVIIQVQKERQNYLWQNNYSLKITSLTKADNYYENHLHRFIRYISLKSIHWINLNHDEIVFKTILK